MTRGRQQRRGAAIIPVARTTQRALIGFRSAVVSKPLVWHVFAGGSNPGESYLETALRELEEETGYNGPIAVRPLYRYPPNVFIGVVPHEFHPVLDWEHIAARWVPLKKALLLATTLMP